MTGLADTLFSKTQQKVLGLLYGHPDQTFYTKEILRSTGMGVATIKRELDRMLAAGILQMNKVGNQHPYQANPQCPIYQELLAIARKTFGVADVLRNCLEPALDEIDLAFIYGSMAKNEDTARSDIDLMVVTDKLTYADLMQHLVDAEKTLGRSVNPSIYTLAQVKKKLSQKASFITRVMDQPKIWVKGTESDIRTPG